MNKRNDWYLPENPEYIGDRKAIKNRKTKEICLAGKNGEIYSYGRYNNKAAYGVVFTKHTIANKYVGASILKKGEELRIIIFENELQAMIKLLKVPKQIKRQLDYANNFGVN